jgi:ribonuclease R
VKFLRGREGEEFAGVVTGVAKFGVFVQLDGGIAEGLVRIERLGTEWFDFDPVRHELRGSATGQTFRLGDAMRVRVERVDAVLRRVDLVPDRRATTGSGSAGAIGSSNDDPTGPKEVRRRAL